MRILILFISLFICAETASSQTAYSWNGSVSTAWNTAANWSPNGIPGSTDNITIVTGSNPCQLSANTGINNIILSSGTLNLGGFTLTTGGPVATFTAGTVQNGTMIVSAATTTVFGNGPVTMNCAVNISSAAVTIRNSTFQNTTNITKTGASNDGSAGNNIFNGVTTMTNSGSGYLMLGNGSADRFNAAATFNNTGSGNIYVDYNGANGIFGALATFNNSPAANTGIYVGWLSAGTTFNDNVIVSSTGGQGVQFSGGNTTATTTLAAGKTISIGAGGFSAGILLLRQFTESGNAPVNLSTTGSSVLYLGPASNFGGPVAVTAPDIWAQGATYNGPASFTKTGGTSNHNNQYQNIFNSTCTINQQSNTGYFMLGYNSNDLFTDDITVTATGSGGINLGWTSGTGTPTLSAGKTILVGGAGFSAGSLSLNTFTQLGNTPVNLNFTGTNTGLVFARGSVIGGNLTISAPDIFFSGATFNGTVTATKTGTGNDAGSGGNIFQGTAVINNAGAGNITFGNGAADKWNSDVSFNSTGSSYIGLAWNSAGNLFNGNINVSSTGSSTGVQFCQNAVSTAILAAGKTLQTGGGGFSSGTLLLRQFTEAGSAPINLTLTGATTVIQLGPASAIGGDFTVSSPRILLNGAVYNGIVNLTKTGATGEWSFGGNTFNSTTTVNQTGSGYFGFANGAPDIYNGDLYVNNNSADRIIFGNNPVGNLFNGNIVLTQTGSSVGIAFGWSGTTNETLAAGKTISVGAAGFSVGYLQIERFTQLGNAPVNLPLTGTSALTFGPTSSFGGDLTSTSGALYFNGCTFNGAVNASKTGATNDNSSGNNIFNGITSITNSGSGNLMFGNGNADQFNTDATFNNMGSGNMYVAHNGANNVFGGVATFNNSPAGNTGIYVGWLSAGTIFSDNVIVSSTGGQGVQFSGGNSTATTTLAAGKTISIGAGGFSAGTLLLRQFTQLGPTAQNFVLTGTGNITYGPSSFFGGDITSASPTLYLNGCTFSGLANITKTGSTGDYSAGGNVFNGISSITNSGSSFLLLGNTNPDIWNNDVTFTNNGSERLLPCWATAGNQFNGNITVNTAGGAMGIQFCGGNGTATAMLAATKTIQSGVTGLTAGYLILKQFTQAGNAPVNLSLASTATYLQFGPSSALGGDITSSSPGLFLNGCIFNASSNCTKTGASSDVSTGHNVFNGPASLTNAGAGYLMLGNGNLDQFNAAANFNNTGSSSIYVAYNSSNNIFNGVTTFNNSPTANTSIFVSWYSAGTIFNDNIIVTATSGQGVQFCGGNTTATTTLVSGKTITIGTAGFSSGALSLKQFTQAGSTPQQITLTGSGSLMFGPSSAFGGNVNTVSPALFFNGCNFSGTVSAVKNGYSNDASIGNNTFNGPFTVTNTGSGYFLMGNGNPDLWQSTAVFNNLSTNQHMYVAYNSVGNTFNGDVFFNNQPASNNLWIYSNYYGTNTQYNGNISVVNMNGAGIYFGSSSGTAVLSAGGAVTVGAGGFNNGGLIFKNFTQNGSGTAQNILTTGSSYIQYGASASFDGPVTSSSPGLFFNGSTFNGIVNCSKTGTTNDQSPGNNIFNGQTTFTNNGTGYLMMTATSPDTYNGNTSFVQNSSGPVYPNYNGSSNYTGNLTVTSPSGSAITFGANTGTAIFSGTGAQTINASGGTPIPVFTRLVIANTGSGVSLGNTSINVSKNLAMNAGLLNTSGTYILTLLNGSTAAAGTASSTSFVNGPMRYQKSTSGATTLNFPVGCGADCRPVSLTVNHTTGNLYTYQAQLFNASAVALGYMLPITVDAVSGVHYYTISRVNAASVSQPALELSGNQTIQLFFGASDVVRNGGTLTIVKNTYSNPAKWIDIGGTGGPVYTGDPTLSGSITSTSLPTAFNSFSTFALGDEFGGGNILPIELLDFKAKPDGSQVDLTWATAMESNNSFFSIEKSRDAVHFDLVQNVNTQAIGGNSSATLRYSSVDVSPYAGLSYYRLKQTDLDGNFTYSDIVPVDFAKKPAVSIYPNPSSGTLIIKGITTNENSLKLDWYDASGRNLLQQTVQVQNGIASLNVPFNSGVYVLRFVTADGNITTRNIIITK